jgi:hypothetical protein
MRKMVLYEYVQVGNAAAIFLNVTDMIFVLRMRYKNDKTLFFF